MYTVLAGAKQNLGDFLIAERSKALLRKHKPGEELIQLPSFKPLTNNLDIVNESKGVVIMGGPGYRPDMYPGIYKLTPNLNDIKVPIILMGMGWKGQKGDLETVKKYCFSQDSMALLNLSLSKTSYLSCRDYYTWYVLKQHNLSNVLMTGCPAWYELNYIGSEYQPPEKIERIAFTPPVYPLFKNQSIQIALVLKKLFPSAEIKAFFHHGFENTGQSGNEAFFRNQRDIRNCFEKIDIKGKDVSGDIRNIKKYRQIDLHVGYRVHAHIDFLSRRRPSILIHEDGRGAGVDDALGVPGINAYTKKCEMSRLKLFDRIIASHISIAVNNQAPELLKHIVERECAHNFSSYAGIGNIIDSYYKIMVKFIRSF